MKLSNIQKDAINLLLRSKDIGEGWRQCAPKIYAIIAAEIPDDLLEMDDKLFRLRLTQEGKAVAKWIC